jgi:hypothetical protein
MPIYQEGQPVRLEAKFYADDVLTDPTTVVLNVWFLGLSGESTTVSTPSVTKDSTGEYSHEFTPTAAGDHFYEWSGEGAVVAFASSEFRVKPKHST